PLYLFGLTCPRHSLARKLHSFPTRRSSDLEVLTPDSSRFWSADSYRAGVSPPSFDKQFVRDYLETLDWNKQAPGPKLPPEIIARTGDKYREALARLTAGGSIEIGRAHV